MAERVRLATDSVFRVAPRNILGLQAQKFKSKLLALALAEPATYFKLRDQVYQSIVETNVEVSYNLYWDILTYCKTPNNEQIRVLKKIRQLILILFQNYQIKKSKHSHLKLLKQSKISRKEQLSV